MDNFSKHVDIAMCLTNRGRKRATQARQCMPCRVATVTHLSETLFVSDFLGKRGGIEKGGN